MPKRRITPKRAAAIKKWQLAGARSRRQKASGRPIGKSQLPHVFYESYTRGSENNKQTTFWARAYSMDAHGKMQSDPYGYASGYRVGEGQTIVQEVLKTARRDEHPTNATLEPGASLLTAIALMTPKGRGFKVVGAARRAWPFYEITGGKKLNERTIGSGANFLYPRTAVRRLARRRIVRVVPKGKGR